MSFRVKTRLAIEINSSTKLQVVTTEGSDELNTDGLIYLGKLAVNSNPKKGW